MEYQTEIDELMKKKKDGEDKTKKDLIDREKLSWDRWELHEKISYKREVDGHGIKTIMWGKDQLLNPEEWEYSLRKMAELNPNDFN
jgi:hypothetical protein